MGPMGFTHPSLGSDGLYPSLGSDGLYPSSGSDGLYPSSGSDGLYPSLGSDGLYPSLAYFALSGLFDCISVRWAIHRWRILPFQGFLIVFPFDGLYIVEVFCPFRAF